VAVDGRAGHADRRADVVDGDLGEALLGEEPGRRAEDPLSGRSGALCHARSVLGAGEVAHSERER
jgi:hypothetical protein